LRKKKKTKKRSDFQELKKLLPEKQSGEGKTGSSIKSGGKGEEIIKLYRSPGIEKVGVELNRHRLFEGGGGKKEGGKEERSKTFPLTTTRNPGGNKQY